ncbi:hypothetical protein K7X08_017656 [Anisodus acutangulus]|uniref:Uncharacterized protein n=1 Tax=Anisodus acutangulus TaxID=402998 RepID=A0A9Q1LYV3_9SOLA|nr:hypothetical protein K7X08_017656 [Anisodus acutangulus]
MEMIRGDLFKRHSDYNIFIDEIGMKLDFIWAPYVSNLTDLVLGFEEKKSYPDVFVIDEKREKMTDVMWQAYTNELYRSKLLQQSGGPLLLLDVHALSNYCGARCTTDGMHYHRVVYEAAVHVMLNALLVESNQNL